MGLRFGKEGISLLCRRVRASDLGPTFGPIAVKIMLAVFQIVHFKLADMRPHGSKLLAAKNYRDDYTRQTEQSHDDRVQDVRDPLAAADCDSGADRICTIGVGVGTSRDIFGCVRCNVGAVDVCESLDEDKSRVGRDVLCEWGDHLCDRNIWSNTMRHGGSRDNRQDDKTDLELSHRDRISDWK